MYDMSLAPHQKDCKYFKASICKLKHFPKDCKPKMNFLNISTIVCAILSKQQASGLNVTLVERKKIENALTLFRLGGVG